MIRETVETFMSRSPTTIGKTETLAVAHARMREQGIRHLPVLDDGLLAGMVSLHDLHLIETLRDVDPAAVAVEDAMTPDPYTVEPDTLLHEVVLEMIGHRFGSAVVVEQGEVVGVFTTVDALRALVTLLGEGLRWPEPGSRRAQLLAAGAGRSRARKPAAKAPKAGTRRTAAAKAKPAAKGRAAGGKGGTKPKAAVSPPRPRGRGRQGGRRTPSAGTGSSAR